MSKVVIGLSGGVDSAVAAILLKNAGYDVYALWIDMGTGSPERAQSAAAALDIPFAVADVRERFRVNVMLPFISEYLAGRTPNPCVMCNPDVKFRALVDYADEIGAGYIATGHYARVIDGQLYEGAGQDDQSYMLYRLPRQWLPRTIFPLGDFASKDEVRAIALDLLPEHSASPASMDICFVPDGDYAGFIERHTVAPPPGDFADENGAILGRHLGIHRYTVGMRRGLGISAGGRLYVTGIDAASNRVVLSDKPPKSEEITLHDTHWLETPEAGAWYDVRLRHSRRKGRCRVASLGHRVCGIQAQPYGDCAAPGQSAVIYSDGKVLGGGIIGGKPPKL